MSRLPAYEVDFAPDDPQNPRHWGALKRGLILAAVSYSTAVVVLYSTSYTAALFLMMEDLGETDSTKGTLGVTTYLFGLAVGSVLWAPLSELYGRRPVYWASMGIFTALIIPCALAKTLWSIILVRFFGAVAGSAMIANAPGTVMDITPPHQRALAFAIWSIGPMNGPVLGPVIGGFTAEHLGWRWTNWLVMILGGVAWLIASLIPETYGPKILQNMAAKKRKETGDDAWWCRYDVKQSVSESLKVNLSRPFTLLWGEPILWFWDAYIAIVYGILYLCFVAYPIIFTQYRHWSTAMSGLAFCGIGLGTMITICSEPLQRRIINMHKKDPETGMVPPEASVSMVCFASLLCPIGQLWFAWTCYPLTIHWIWPILAGVPFGIGNGMVFIYAGNYVSGAYGIYAASAMAGNSVVRSIIGGTLPLAGAALYKSLGPNWAGTLLGLLEVACIPIPFVFYKWGDRIRSKSKVISQMREEDIRQARRSKKNQDIRDRDQEKGRLEGEEKQKEAERLRNPKKPDSLLTRTVSGVHA